MGHGPAPSRRAIFYSSPGPEMHCFRLDFFARRQLRRNFGFCSLYGLKFESGRCIEQNFVKIDLVNVLSLFTA